MKPILDLPTFLTQVAGSTVWPVASLTTFAASHLKFAPGYADVLAAGVCW